MSEHAVIVSFDYGSTDLEPLFELEEQLESRIEDAGVGEFDGNEVAVDGSDGRLYMYGPDADALFAAVKDTLAGAAAVRAARGRRTRNHDRHRKRMSCRTLSARRSKDAHG